MKVLARVIVALLLTAVVGALIVGGLVAYSAYQKTPLPWQDHCVARVQDLTISLDADQSRHAAIIAGVATQRGLVPRATTIALATAYQESGLHNLDYGDRDSLGLFQQRPSQGWGTQEQVMAPWYAANAFYEALVKVPDWQTGDVNDVAQTVQRSGHPNAYAKHVENARRIASSLTGETPASFSCLVRSPSPADPGGLATFLEQTLPSDVSVASTATGVTVRAPSDRAAWSAAQIVVANAGRYGVREVGVAGRTWRVDPWSAPSWSAGAGSGRVVEVTTA